MITRGNIMTRKGKRYEAEYTTKCGWIDWNHADGDRPDLYSIFKQIPPSSKKLKTFKDSFVYKSLKLSAIFNKESRKILNNNRDDYFANFSIDQNWKQKTRSFLRKTDINFVIPKYSVSAIKYYKQVAFTMFKEGCDLSENLQEIAWGAYTHNSHFSMEDLTSNTMAFYMQCENFSHEKIIRLAGGWVDPEEAKEKSLEIFNKAKMSSENRNKDWSKAYLFNNLLKSVPSDNKQGWSTIPEEFRKFPSLKRKKIGVGRDSFWLITSGALFTPSYYTPQTNERRKIGRIPGPSHGRIPGYEGKNIV